MSTSSHLSTCRSQRTLTNYRLKVLVLALADIMETYIGAHTKHHSHHFVSELSSADCTAATLLSHDSQDPTILDSWCYSPGTCASLSDTNPLRSFPPLFVTHLQDGTPQDNHTLFIGDIYSSPPSQESALKQPISFFGEHFMDSDSPSEHSGRAPLHSYLPGSHDTFYRPQPPSPPLDTPELVQRSLPEVRELLSPTSTSLDSLELSPTSTVRSEQSDATSSVRSRPCLSGHDDLSVPCKYQRYSDGLEDGDIFLDGAGSGLSDTDLTCEPQLPPLEMLTPDMPMTAWPTPANVFQSDQVGDMQENAWGGIGMWTAVGTSSVPFSGSNSGLQGPSKPRGLSLDSAHLEDYDFLAPHKASFRHPLRSHTTLLKPMPELEGPWETDHHMEVDPAPPHSPLADSLLLPLNGFDSDPLNVDVFGEPDDSSSSLTSEALAGVFDGGSLGFSPVYELPDFEMEDAPTAPSSPRSPLMQLAPDDDMVDVDVPSDGTISPSLLGPPAPGEGLGLFVEPSGVEPPFARSPSPSDYELHILEGQVDVVASGLPEDEYSLLRAFYEGVAQAEASARERENALDRRVRDISALMDPSKVVSDPIVMYSRRQELRTATDMRTEARRVRKRERQRLKEIGAILDLKLDLDRSVFQRRASMRSVPQLVANMVLKRRDTTRALASRKSASSGSAMTPSPLRTSAASEDSEIGEEDEIDAE